MSERSVNRCTLIGRLGRDAETSFTPSGAAATKFSVATTRRWKDKADEWKEETNWTNCVVWQQEKLGQYLTKGKQVYVEGRLQTRSYDDKSAKRVYVTEVVADEVILLGGQESSGHSGAGQQASRAAANGGSARAKAAAAPDDAFAGMTIDDSDIPF
jgi:single-strand DNA-binding protein